mmetsp:Transcript_11036/g.32934  ORF Transcript_11036/g.32934 Transcript_11036/m.32934 type:complete len:169 (+) Transcript_11036:157-663(+)
MLFAPAAATVALSLALVATPPDTLPPCRGESDCISSNGREAPNHFQAPTSFAPATKAKAFQAAKSALSQCSDVVDDSQSYLRARCEGDVVELLLRDDLATFRVAAVSKGVTPPWCLEKNCINGSMQQRRRILALAKALGWSPVDSTNLEDEGRWTPIFFNTDAVPRDE